MRLLADAFGGQAQSRDMRRAALSQTHLDDEVFLSSYGWATHFFSHQARQQIHECPTGLLPPVIDPRPASRLIVHICEADSQLRVGQAVASLVPHQRRSDVECCRRLIMLPSELVSAKWPYCRTRRRAIAHAAGAAQMLERTWAEFHRRWFQADASLWGSGSYGSNRRRTRCVCPTRTARRPAHLYRSVPTVWTVCRDPASAACRCCGA